MLNDLIVTKDFLRKNPMTVFVFGDNTIRSGYGGAAYLRDEANSYGFITKKFPNTEPESYYTIEEYIPVFNEEMKKLNELICNNRQKRFLISRIGRKLANKYGIYEAIIWPKIQLLKELHPNIMELWYEIS